MSADYLLVLAVLAASATAALYHYVKPNTLQCTLTYTFKQHAYAQSLLFKETSTSNMWTANGCDAFGPYSIVLTS